MANEVQKYTKDITPYLDRAAHLAVKSTEDVEAARDYIRDIKGQIKAVKDFFDPRIDQANKLHKGLIADRAVFETPLKGAQGVIEGKVSGYIAAEQEKARKEAERQAEEARKEHEKEVARAAKSVEAMLEKAGSLQEQIILLEEELEKPNLTEEEALAVASRLDIAKARLDAAEQKVAVVTEQATRTYTPPPPPVTEKVAGVSVREKLEPVITNPALIIHALHQGQVPMSIISFNLPQIAKLINAGVKIPGVGSTTSRKTVVR